MASTDSDPEIAETARILQQQIVYNGEILDITLESVRTYKEGTQSLRYLDSSVHLAYALLRMLERWSKRSGEMYVRKKAKKKTKGNPTILLPFCSSLILLIVRRDHDTEAGPVPDVEEEPEPEPDEEVIHETMFTFDSFEAVCFIQIITTNFHLTVCLLVAIRTSRYYKYVAHVSFPIRGIQLCRKYETSS